MKGDVRTDSTIGSVFLYRGNNNSSDYASGPSVDGDDDVDEVLQREKIRPYTRKWEPAVMGTVQQLELIMKKGNSGDSHHCDVRHNVTAVFFSTSGYTGNLYHEFNDGIIPLYVTVQHLKKQVILVVVDYKNWWYMKYADVVSELSDYPIIDFSGDNRTHCFPEAIVGLRIHDDLHIDPSLMEGNRTIRDFRNLLDRAYWPRIKGLIEDEEREAAELLALAPPSEQMLKQKSDFQTKPKLVIISRNGSREITNQDAMIELAEEIGFSVEIVVPDKTSELAKIYRELNSSDVLIGVHGAALTHFLFMKPGSVFIQVSVLGTEWASDKYFGSTAVKFGLKYVGYQILPEESSLYDSYAKDDPVLVDPYAVNRRGWEVTKQIYLDHQNVRLNLRRFGKVLYRAYYYTLAKRKGRVLPLDLQ
ncbi:OLC1v1036763C1 [Oldenlandia corymbosa var. corymbosa]|nr:OLC1v1036763C1 [Oldenlandia corymbosa var. corymbosa]